MCGELGLTYLPSNGLLRSRLVDFLLVIIELFWQLMMMHKDDKCVNISAFLGVRHEDFLIAESVSPPPFLHRSTLRCFSTTLPLRVFTQTNFVTDFLRVKFTFPQKTRNFLVDPLFEQAAVIFSTAGE